MAGGGMAEFVSTPNLREAHTAILMTGMLQVAHSVRVTLDIVLGQLRSIIGRAIIHQEQFPIGVGLGQHALNGLSQKLPGVQESNHHEDSGGMIYQRDPILSI
jgi:hypothetical protein